MKQLEDMWVDYPGRDRFTYGDVYRLIKEHSTILDRLNPKKVIFMAVYAFDILSGIQNEPKKKNWSFIDEFWKY